MRTFTLLALLGGAVGSTILDRAQKCNADNCYRVMNDTQLVASQFCSTFLQSTTTTTITPIVTVRGTQTFSNSPVPTITPLSIPTHISQQCILATATPLVTRLSSACSCISATPTSRVTVTSTVTAPPMTTTLPPLTPCEALTEQSDIYKVDPNNTFKVICNQWFWANYQHPDFHGLANLEACMVACSQHLGCVAIDWNEPVDGGESACGVLYDFEGPIIGTAVNACAIKMN